MSRLRPLAETTLLIAIVVLACSMALHRWQPVRVAGGSMRPALAPGDLAIVDRRGNAQRGQIALLESARHGAVLHRVVAVRPDGSVSTQGDANPIADLDALPSTAVVGPVVAVVPVGTWIERWRGSAVCDTMTAQQNSSRQ